MPIRSRSTRFRITIATFLWMQATACIAQTTGVSRVAPFNGGLYSNPYSQSITKGPGAYARMRLLGDEPWADFKATAHRVPRARENLAAINQPNPETLQVTWIGRSSVLIQYRGKDQLRNRSGNQARI